MADKYTDI